MTKTTTREAAVAEALTWQGTPFAHLQSCKGVASDCVGLVIGVFKALGCIDPQWFPRPYAQHWHVHKNQELLLETLQEFGFTEKPAGDLLPGDLLVFRFGRVSSHVGLYVGNGEMVHAYFGLGRAVKQPLAGDFAKRLSHVMQPPFFTS
jgi:NlpC/P60 family putative phage cell wall peptidase